MIYTLIRIYDIPLTTASIKGPKNDSDMILSNNNRIFLLHARSNLIKRSL